MTSFFYHECKDHFGSCITAQEWEEVHALYSRPEYLNAVLPYPEAAQELHRLARYGEIHFVTSRLKYTRNITGAWLDRHGFPPGALHYVSRGQKHTLGIRFTGAVEDDYEQAVGFALVARTPCIIYKHLWNENRLPFPRMTWSDNWFDIVEQLIAL
jgi:uncharacterized HAD superfamily protein